MGFESVEYWLRRADLNRRPSGYEPDELTTALLRGNRYNVDGVKGFEPLNDRTKTCCLTAWLYPSVSCKDEL